MFSPDWHGRTEKSDQILQAIREELQATIHTHLVDRRKYETALALLRRLEDSHAKNPNGSLISKLREAKFPMRRLDDFGVPKWVVGYEMLRADPHMWFRESKIEEREKALLFNASPVPGLTIGESSFLDYVHHQRTGHPLSTIIWTANNDWQLRGMVSEFGAEMIGWARGGNPFYEPVRTWEHMMVKVNVEISVNMGNIAGVGRGILAANPSKATMLAGPWETCPHTPWHVMILRDVVVDHPNISNVAHMASRQFDILLMKACENPYRHF